MPTRIAGSHHCIRAKVKDVLGRVKPGQASAMTDYTATAALMWGCGS
jgi:hypothetical protein